MFLRGEQNLRKFAGASLFLAAAACLSFLAARVYYAISFVTPYMMVTTGCEEESLFSIWKFTRHEAVYADLHRIPFAASDFNWGYYYFYGSIARACLQWLHLGAIWIPTIGRLITLAFTLATGGVFWLALRKFTHAGFFAGRAAALAWCVIAAVSPLVGFWSITTRPDMGALAFETAGLYLTICYFRRQDGRLPVAAALLFYAAWAFKQSSVTMLAGSALALLLLKRGRAFLFLSGIWSALVAITLVAGGDIYRQCIFFPQAHCLLLARTGLRNAWLAGLRNPFLVPAAAAVLFMGWRRWRSRSAVPMETGLTLVVLFSCGFALITACKTGAVTNYYIPAAWAAMLAFALFSERLDARGEMAVIAICSWLLIAGVWRGHLFYGPDYRYSNSIHQAVAEKLIHLPGPVLVSERYSNLPWVQPFPPHFVLGPTYGSDRDAGMVYEHGGWEGLLAEGYFGTVVTEQGAYLAPELVIPPVLLAKYELADEFKDAHTDFKFYRLRRARTPTP